MSRPTASSCKRWLVRWTGIVLLRTRVVELQNGTFAVIGYRPSATRDLLPHEDNGTEGRLWPRKVPCRLSLGYPVVARWPFGAIVQVRSFPDRAPPGDGPKPASAVPLAALFRSQLPRSSFLLPVHEQTPTSKT